MNAIKKVSALSCCAMLLAACGGGGGGGGGGPAPPPPPPPNPVTTHTVTLTSIELEDTRFGDTIAVSGLPVDGATVTVD